MDFDVTRQQWLDRFVQRLAQREPGGVPDEFVALAERLYPSQGQIAADAAADAEYAARAGKAATPEGDR